jgi:ABC-type transport system substrate-binding protein
MNALADWDFTHEEYESNFLEWRQPKDQAAREAVQLLNSAGFTRENPLRFTMAGSNPERSELLQAQWRRLTNGIIDAQLQGEADRATLNRITANRDFDYIIYGLSGGIPDVDATFSLITKTGGSRNFADFSDAQTDRMIDQQRRTFNIDERKALVKDILRRLIDISPYTIASNPFSLMARKPYVQGIVPENRMNGRQYQYVWRDA